MNKRIDYVFLSFTIIMILHGPASSASVTVMHGWPAQQGEAFNRIVNAFEKRHPDIDVVVEVVGRDRPAVLAARLAAGNPPDITPHPWVGLQAAWARAGQIVRLDGLVDTSGLLDPLKPLGQVDGKLYGLFIFPNIKSLVWYNKRAFESRGYQPPESWTEMIALSRRIVNDGGIPWAIGLESGAASGWPGTDWIEDILLRSAGPLIYDKWVEHKIPWTHPEVKKAFEYFGQIVLNPKFVLGGSTGALTTNFGDSPSALFTHPPQAFLHRQATFIQGFIRNQNPDLKPGVDYDVFPFPPIKAETGKGVPVLVSGDVINCFRKDPEVIQFARFLISLEAQKIWVQELDELSSNTHTDPKWYANPITRTAWDILSSADVSRYDGSDMMPPAVGAGSFWSGVLDYVSGIPLNTVLQTIEASAADAYSGR